LGPHALFYGIFHRSWFTLQKDYLRAIHQPTHRNQGRQAIELIALHFQATARAQWDTRKHHLHETHDNHQPYARTILSEDIRHIYEQLPDILPLDRPAITQGILLKDRLQHPTKRLRHWLRHVPRSSRPHSNKRPHGHPTPWILRLSSIIYVHLSQPASWKIQFLHSSLRTTATVVVSCAVNALECLRPAAPSEEWLVGSAQGHFTK
jgi:hypothetical protein